MVKCKYCSFTVPENHQKDGICDFCISENNHSKEDFKKKYPDLIDERIVKECVICGDATLTALCNYCFNTEDKFIPTERKCLTCSKSFMPKRRQSMFCSQLCNSVNYERNKLDNK